MSVVLVQSAAVSRTVIISELLAESGNMEPEHLKCGKLAEDTRLPVKTIPIRHSDPGTAGTQPTVTLWHETRNRGTEEQREKGEKREYLVHWTVHGAAGPAPSCRLQPGNNNYMESEF